MNDSAPQKREGLRARKRRATENAIETSAVDLALELGMEHVTVEAICDRAGVARSTFFNYFSSRDSAIVGRSISIPDAESAFPILDATPDNLTRGIFHLLFAAIGHNFINTAVASKRATLIAEQPRAAAATTALVVESGTQLTDVAAAWLVAHPEHARLDSPVHEAQLSSTAVLGVLNSILLNYAAESDDLPTDDSAFDQYIADFRTILG